MHGTNHITGTGDYTSFQTNICDKTTTNSYYMAATVHTIAPILYHIVTIQTGTEWQFV